MRHQYPNFQRVANEGENVRDRQTGVIHAAKHIDERGGATWCNHTFNDRRHIKGPIDDFQGEYTSARVSCINCIAYRSNDDAANEEEDRWRSTAPRT